MVTGLAGQQDFAAIGLVDAGDDLDERRFAGAVFAEQGVDLAGIEGQRDVLQRLRGVEPLGDVAHLEDGRRAAVRRVERQVAGACSVHRPSVCHGVRLPRATQGQAFASSFPDCVPPRLY